MQVPALAHLNSAEYAFHDTALGANVGTAVHAVALDEHRIDYMATLWTSVPDPTVAAAPIDDSYGEFLGGLYAATHPPYDRPMRIRPDFLQTVNESVYDRYRADASYRPRNPGFRPPA